MSKKLIVGIVFLVGAGVCGFLGNGAWEEGGKEAAKAAKMEPNSKEQNKQREKATEIEGAGKRYFATAGLTGVIGIVLIGWGLKGGKKDDAA